MQEIGRRLREKRIEKNFSIEEVHRRTRVPVKFLKDIEEGEYAQFYAAVYYTASLRKYARFLGLDENELMALYRARSGQPEGKPDVIEKETDREASNKKIVFGALVSLVILAAAGFFIAQYKARPRLPDQTAERGQPTALSVQTSQGADAPSAVPQSAAEDSRSAPADVNGFSPRGSTDQGRSAGQGLTLEIRAVRDSWLRITADTTEIFEGILSAGNSRRWTADQRYDIIIGYVPGIEATLNGRPLDVRQGAVKDVNQITLTRETLKSL